MKRKTFKRIGAILLAMITVFAMSVPAFAANAADGAGVTITGAADNTLTFVKEIAVFNPTSHTVYYPGITYNYTIAPVTAAALNGATITDSNDKVAVVKAGISTGANLTTDSTAAITAGSVIATPTGAIISDTVTVTIVPGEFPSAGVYRYVITEADPADRATKGYERASANIGTRYLDVYIVNDDSSGLKVGGYVLFAGNANDSITATDESAKTTGFSGKTSADYSTDGAIDKYKTYNVDITKTVTGALGDKNNAFPFSAGITSSLTDSAVTIPTEITTAATTGTQKANLALTSGAATAVNIADLKHGGTVRIAGIPVNATVSITEQNNTADTYKVTTTGFTDNLDAVSVTATNSTTAKTITTSAVELKQIGYTNNLEAISPTGVYLRYGAFLGILAAGIAILIVMVARRRRDRKEM